MSIVDKILSLTKQLYPRGRAFKMPFDGVLESLHKALSISEAQAYTDAIAIHDSMLPDNSNFSISDAQDWERRLGLISNEAVSLSDRKLAIERKLNQPGLAPAKSNWRYLQLQLQNAGFDVYIYENRFDDYPDGYITKTPVTFASDSSFFIGHQYGEFQYGEFQYGGRFTKFVANHIDETRDWEFNIAPDLRSTFFVGGATAGSFANVDSARKDEFRKLILTIKPVQCVAYLLIDYI